MTKTAEQILNAAGIAPIAFADEIGAAFMYDFETLTTWIPAKTARVIGADLEAEGFTVEIVGAPKRDRKRAFEMDHCPGF